MRSSAVSSFAQLCFGAALSVCLGAQVFWLFLLPSILTTAQVSASLSFQVPLIGASLVQKIQFYGGLLELFLLPIGFSKMGPRQNRIRLRSRTILILVTTGLALFTWLWVLPRLSARLALDGATSSNVQTIWMLLKASVWVEVLAGVTLLLLSLKIGSSSDESAGNRLSF